MTTACMGGWKCPKREQCARYHSMYRREPAERLCEPGKTNMFLALKPVRVVTAPAQPEAA